MTVQPRAGLDPSASTDDLRVPRLTKVTLHVERLAGNDGAHHRRRREPGTGPGRIRRAGGLRDGREHDAHRRVDRVHELRSLRSR